MNVGCPTCGAAVEFRFDDSFVRVCSSCRSAVLRTDRGIETLGKLADLVPLESSLRLFAEGRYDDAAFLLIGMAQLQHAAGGLWQEWYAKLDGGKWAWISEAQGRCYVTLEQPDVTAPPFEAIQPGAVVSLAGRTYTASEVGTASYASAAGEIPYRLEPGASFQFADLADGQGGFATIDYNDGSEAPSVYLGRQVDAASLRLHGGEAPPAAAAARAPRQGAALPCPNCGGSLELKAPDQTLRVACPYCNHLVSVQAGNLAVLGKLSRRANPTIPLGAVGKFSEGELTVIGYMQRSALVDGDWYPFDEYLLHAPGVGFRWLVSSDGHWSYVQPVAPGAVEHLPLRYEGVEFELFLRADLRVDMVLGEFYWQVKEGERVVGEDYIAPPAMLSCETSPTEQSWSLSTYMTVREVQRAFEPRDMPLPPPSGVGANQPYPMHGVSKVAWAALGLLCVVGIARCSGARNDLKFTARIDMPPGAFSPATPSGTASTTSTTPTTSTTSSSGVELPALPDLNADLSGVGSGAGSGSAAGSGSDAGSGSGSGAGSAAAPAEVPANVAFTEKFRLDGGENIEISLAAPLSNEWAYAAIDLVNDKTGGVVSFDANLESYSGYEDGESWSEGSDTASQVLGPTEAGEYMIRVESLHSRSSGPIPLSITVRQDVFRARYWLLAALLLGLPFGIVGLHALSFKKKRWENSQLTRSVQGARTEPDEDDDSSGGTDED